MSITDTIIIGYIAVQAGYYIGGVTGELAYTMAQRKQARTA